MGKSLVFKITQDKSFTFLESHSGPAISQSELYLKQ